MQTITDQLHERTKPAGPQPLDGAAPFHLPEVSHLATEPTPAETRAEAWHATRVEHQVLQLAADLIRIPSVTGNEQAVVRYMEELFLALDWNPRRIPVPGTDRDNLLVTFGEPRVLFTTHCDVVPGPEDLFTPRITSDYLIGRGACDVKGALGAMIAAAHNLRLAGETNFGLLVVVGEEVDGIGAKTAGRALSGAGVRYLVNAEPTDGKLALGHTGAVTVQLTFKGTACHSGYPELGDDANAKALRTAAALLAADYGSDPVLGRPVRNVGRIEGGVAANLIAPSASFTFMVRTVTNDPEPVAATIRELAREADELKVLRIMQRATMTSVPGFETTIVRFGTDIPHFLEGMNAEPLLYGPGSVHQAHTDGEFVRLADLVDSVTGYERIFGELKARVG